MLTSGRIPSVFVSSTFYDLSQIRADIYDFIKSFAMEPVLSEYNDFPIDPDLGTIENCLRAVETRADIFILIVGGRYGSTNYEGKSVTNLEYLRAKSKRIPIYVFVHNSIIDMLPVWKENPEGNFQSVVDSPNLFEFVESIRGSGEVWVFPFERAQDIISTLRQQLAFLFMDALTFRYRLRGDSFSDALSQLHGKSLRMALEKPIAWEYLLFSQILLDELHAARNLRQDLKYNIAFGEGQSLDQPEEILSFIQHQNHFLAQVSSGLDRLVNKGLLDAISESQSTGDPKPIMYIARKIVEAYREAIKWTLNIRRTHVEDRYQSVIQMASNLSENMINEIEEFSESLGSKLTDAIVRSNSGESVTLELTLTLTIPDTEPLLEEIRKLLL